MSGGCGVHERRTRRLALPLAAIASSAIVACGSGDETTSGGQHGGPTGCAPGEATRDDGSCQPAGVPADACGDGFAPDERGGCDAVLPTEVCPKGQMAIPGETSCHVVAACGSGTWGDIPLDATTEFVDATYVGTSDGSQAHPWTTIQDAVDAAAAGSVVAVAAGSYVEQVVIFEKPVRLWGTCPSAVEIVAPSTAAMAVQIRNVSAGVEIHRLAVTSAQFGVVASGAAGVLVDHVWVHDTGRHGIHTEETLGPVQIEIDDSLVENASLLGIDIAGTNAAIARSCVRGVKRPADATSDAAAIQIEVGYNTPIRASGTVGGCVIEANDDGGIAVIGSDATITDSVVRGSLPVAGVHGIGIVVQSFMAPNARGSATISRCVADDNAERAILVNGADATIDSTVVRRTKRVTKGGFGISFQADVVEGRATGTIRASLVEHNVLAGIAAHGADLTLESVLVRDTQPTTDVAGGDGIFVLADPVTGERANLVARSCVVESSSEIGLCVSDSDATIDATRVSNTAADSDGEFGDGICVLSTGADSSATITRSLAESSARAGLSVFGASVELGSSTMDCNAIDVAAESNFGRTPSFDDLGANVCGCSGKTLACAAQSSELAPPQPIEPVPP